MNTNAKLTKHLGEVIEVVLQLESILFKVKAIDKHIAHEMVDAINKGINEDEIQELIDSKYDINEGMSKRKRCVGIVHTYYEED